MTKRTDVHNAVNLVTEDYEYITTIDLNPEDEAPQQWFSPEEHAAINAVADDTARGLGQCHHCGAHMRYSAIMLHKPSGEYIAVGEQCLQNRFDRATGDFQRLRKTAELARADRRIIRIRDAWFAEDPSREIVFEWASAQVQAGDHGWQGSLHNFVHKINRNGSTSDKFVAMVQRAMDSHAERMARKAEREAAEALLPSEPVIEGKLVITGEVLTTKLQDSDFGSTWKMLVRDDRGFKVWGTIPASLQGRIDWDDEGQKVIAGAERGDRVTFSATVERSRDDAQFGFFKRPTKASIIATAEVTD